MVFPNLPFFSSFLAAEVSYWYSSYRYQTRVSGSSYVNYSLSNCLPHTHYNNLCYVLYIHS
jgi:hypothetical protein